MNQQFKSIVLALLLIIFCKITFAHQKDTLNIKHLEFIENRGQWHSNVLFKTAFNGNSIFFERNAITFLSLRQSQLEEFYNCKHHPHSPCLSDGKIDAAAYQVRFLHSNPEVRIMGRDETTDYLNYYTGDDPSHWATRVNKFHEIFYDELYRGIDMVYYQRNNLKYEFIIDPGVSPQKIQMLYDGIEKLSVVRNHLYVKTAVSQIIELQPYAYQINAQGDTISINCEYQINKQTVSFKVGSYDKSLPLVIDPNLVFSTFSGSYSDNWGYSATYDNNGCLYAGGNTFGAEYPTSRGAFQIDYAGGSCDIAISKFSPNGKQLLYSTILGGNSTDVPHSLIVNENNELYILGTTGSSNYPTTANAYQRTFKGGTNYTLTGSLKYKNGSDIVITKFNSDGTRLLGSTYFGGTGSDGLNTPLLLKINYADEVRGEIILDEHSNVYVVSCTQSADLPVSSKAFQKKFGGSTQDGCVFKMNHDMSNLIWCSYLGGSGQDAAYSIVLGNDNSLYVCGGTSSSDFPVTANAYQRSIASSMPEGFITRISNDGTQILNSTFLGSKAYDQTYLIKNDKEGYPYVFGQTNAEGEFWIKNVSWYVYGGGQFLTKLSHNLDQIIWSTAFGSGKGGPDISPSALMIDLCQNIYMSGWGSLTLNNFGGTTGLPITRDAYQRTTDNNDYYFICLDENVSRLVYASYFGSMFADEHVDGGTSRFDRKGTIYQAVCAGCGGTSTFPTSSGVWSRTNNSENCNIGVIKFDFDLPAVVADFIMPNTICAPYIIDFENTSQSASENTTEYAWDFGDGTTSNEKSPSHLYSESGTYKITLIVKDVSTCNVSDTMIKTLVVLSNSLSRLPDKGICIGNQTQIGVAPSGNTEIKYRWTPATGLDNPNLSNPNASPTVSTDYQLIITDSNCVDTILQRVIVEDLDIVSADKITICKGDSTWLEPTVLGGGVYFIWSLSPDFKDRLNADTTQLALLITPDKRTKYYLKVIGNYCVTTTSMEVDLIEINIKTPKEYKICKGNSTPISIMVEPADATYTYEWEPSASIVSGNGTANPVVAPTADTRFKVVVTNSQGCTASAEVDVLVKEIDPNLNFRAWSEPTVIYKGEKTNLHATELDGFQYSWTPDQSIDNPTQANTQATLEHNTCFTCTITNNYGCTKSDTTCVKVLDVYCEEPYIFVPNAFTPNGDGKNDILYVRGDDYLVSILFRIYNRWGEKIFESQELSSGWDGTFKGEMCQPGVYDYYLEATCYGQQKFIKKGNITLIR